MEIKLKAKYKNNAKVKRVLKLAVEVMGSEESAQEWLLAPHFSLDTVPPIEMLKTDDGAKEVEDILGRIKHGMCL
jgi:putative toxin-antitoxin system antitoxin component (TIGR02293 family)